METPASPADRSGAPVDRSDRRARGLWGWWLLACAAAWLIGRLLGIGGLPSGGVVLVMAILMAVGQWLVLRSVLEGVRAWIPLTVVGWVIGSFVASLAVVGGTVFDENVSEVARQMGREAARADPLHPFKLLIVVGFGLHGLVLGALQWLVLRRFVDAAWRWPLISAGGLALAQGMFIWLGSDLATLGTYYGIVTGVLLGDMLAKRLLPGPVGESG